MKLRFVAVFLSMLLGWVSPAIAQEAQDTLLSDSYFLYYYRDRSDVQEDYLDNARQIARIRQILAQSPRIDSITIYSYSSPEGARGRNDVLAQKRAESARDFILANLPSDSVLRAENIRLCPMGENWDGLYKELDANYHLMNRDRVMKVMNANVPTETKKWRLKRLDNGFTYRWIIQHHMPALRQATWICVFQTTPELSKDTTYTINMETVPIAADTLPAPEEPEAPVAIVPETRDTVRTRSFKAPVWALKTNLLYDAALVPNVGLEFYLGKNFSVAANWHYAWWNSKSWFWRTYGGELAVRKWLGSAARERALTGHHVGVYAQILAYDFMVGQRGYMSGHPGETLFDRPNYTVGLEYGYSMPIAKRLSLDFVLGVGYHGGLYNEYLYMDDHYVWHTTKKRSFFGPTKAEVTLVWLLGPVNKKKGGDR